MAIFEQISREFDQTSLPGQVKTGYCIGHKKGTAGSLNLFKLCIKTTYPDGTFDLQDCEGRPNFIGKNAENRIFDFYNVEHNRYREDQ